MHTDQGPVCTHLGTTKDVGQGLDKETRYIVSDIVELLDQASSEASELYSYKSQCIHLFVQVKLGWAFYHLQPKDF